MVDDGRQRLIEAIRAGLAWVNEYADAFAIKTQEFYARTLTRAVRSFYNGYMEIDDFIAILTNLVVGQLRKAWFEGMAENGLTPEDMTAEWAIKLREIVQSEQDHIPQYAIDVERARREDTPIDPLLARAELWANRYNDVVNQAKMYTAAVGQKQEWVLGDTEKHCHTGDNDKPGIGCSELAGTVAFASEWARSPYHPQQPPNDHIPCGGWRCDCKLIETNKRRTANVEEILGI